MRVRSGRVSGRSPGISPGPAVGGRGGGRVEGLIERIEARERRADGLRLVLRTDGRLPDGAEFSTRGTYRMRRSGGEAAPATSLHVGLVFEVARDGLVVETELLRTPEGVWTREKSPVVGQVVTYMTPELLAQVESASRALEVARSRADAPRDEGADGGGGRDEAGREAAGVGGGEARPDALRAVPVDEEVPMGAVMLRELAAAFELVVRGTKTVDGVEFLVVSGPAREAPRDVEDDGAPDFVEVLVRAEDTVVTGMRQLRAGAKLLEVTIERFEIAPEFDDDAFAPGATVLAEGRDALVVDVMDHAPAAEEIRWLLREAEAAGWKPADAGDGAGTRRGR